jgi:hypothetical protein
MWRSVRWTHRTPHWVRWTQPTPHWGAWADAQPAHSFGTSSPHAVPTRWSP